MGRAALRRPGSLVAPLVGTGLTLLAAALAVHEGATIGIAVLGVLLVYVGSVVAYLTAPHRAMAATVVFFALLPTLQVFISPSLGGIKDVICIGAITAGAVLFVVEKRRADRWLSLLIAIFMLIYVVNIGGSHGDNWAQGVRLTGEPVLLLAVGCLLPDPRRNLRWALGGFIVAGVVAALYGVLQEGLGISRLESLGYVYGIQLRQYGSALRSFGTFDNAFDYAGFLYFSVVASFWALRRGRLLWVVETILLLGLVVSFVRTAGLVLLGLLSLGAIHRRLTFPALCLVVAVGTIASLTLVHASGIETQSYEVYYAGGGSALVPRPVDDPGGVLLNGRISAWTAAVGSHPIDWIFGRGVGEVGTAAQRASVGAFTSASSQQDAANTTATAVDSGYLATVADVGIVGLLVELGIFGRIIYLGARRVRSGRIEGWIPISFLTALLLDALTRASFTGFPTAFVGFMLVGVSIAALPAEEGSVAPSRRRASGDHRSQTGPLRPPASSTAT